MDEAKLIRQLRSGVPGALDRLIRLYTPYLSTVLYRSGGGRLTREDQEALMADAFVALWQNADTLDTDRGSVRAYLAAVVRNGVYKRARDRKETFSLREADGYGAGSAAEDADRLDLWDAVAQLGEEDHEIFLRFYRYDQSLRKIAAAMGMKVSTVKTRRSRGRAKLKTLLSEAEGET